MSKRCTKRFIAKISLFSFQNYFDKFHKLNKATQIGKTPKHFQDHSTPPRSRKHTIRELTNSSNRRTSQLPVTQKQVPIYQYTLPLPSTLQKSDRQQQLLLVKNHFNDSANGLGLAGQLFQDDNSDNKSESAIVQASLEHKTGGSHLFLSGTGMTSPRGKGRQPVLPITENHSNGGGLLSPRQRDGTNNAVTTVIPHGETKETVDEDLNPSLSPRLVSFKFFTFHNYRKFMGNY